MRFALPMVITAIPSVTFAVNTSVFIGGSLLRALQQNHPGLAWTGDVLNCLLKIRESVLTRDFEQVRVPFCEIQSKFEVLVPFLLAQAKPTHDQHALQRHIVWRQRINIHSSVALERTEVNDSSSVVENLSQLLDRLSAQGIERHLQPVSGQRLAHSFFPIAAGG